MTPGLFIAALLAYILAGRMAIQRLAGRGRELAFAALNLAGLYWFCMRCQNDHYNAAFVVYLAVVLFQFAAMWFFSDKAGWKPWLAFFTPITVLIVVRYLPLCFYGHAAEMMKKKLEYPLSTYLVGISYLAFRSSHLVLEVRNRVVKKPGLWEYLGFCFFVPTIPVGPINPYSNFRRAFGLDPEIIPAGRAALRIIVGLVKYQFLGSVFDRLTYDGFLLNEHPHHWIDLPVGVICYYLYLYCNFSGFCDMAIGAAGLIGIPVPENFDNPLAARNMKEFWNRWHITLSSWMRDVVFSPLSKFLVRLFGIKQADHAIALTIVIVFLLVGIWHGVGWNFVAYGAAHALGVVTNHYYTILLKKKLGREGFRAYNENRWIHAVAVAATFVYVAATLILFANSFSDIKIILHSLR
jgi:D-alanyl-lipoteichoic acid acyltransferase DltB (MBOAT superfamily)